MSAGRLTPLVGGARPRAESGEAIALLGVDDAVAPEALAEIAALPQIRQAKALRF